MIKIKAFITHKKAEKFEDCQDSFAIDKENLSIAIADGISQSIFPKKWADLLTTTFVKNPDFMLNTEEDINSLREKWWLYFHEELERQQKDGVPTVWLLENCYNNKKSAGATFAGIRFGIDNKVVNYEILGDSCLIVIKNDQIKRIISSKPDGEAFDNYPDYIDSNELIGTKGSPNIGKVPFSDFNKIFLVTDALSDKFNEEEKIADQGRSIIEKLSKIEKQEEFEELVDALRNDGMSNDDTTFVCINKDTDDSMEFEVVFETPLDELIAKEMDLHQSVSKKNMDENGMPAPEATKEEGAEIGVTEDSQKKTFPQMIESIFLGLFDDNEKKNTKEIIINLIDKHKEDIADKIIKETQNQ